MTMDCAHDFWTFSRVEGNNGGSCFFFPANPPMFELILAAMKETLVSIKHDSHMAAEKNTRL